MNRRFVNLGLAFAVYCSGSKLAFAQGSDEVSAERGEAPPIGLDVEVDPFAYLLEGYSVHAGLRASQLRLDLGAFAARYPDFLASNPELEGSAQGAGLKLDWRFSQRPRISSDWLTELSRGAFVGLGVAYAWLDVRDPASGQATSQFQVHASMRAGWDIPVAGGFYLAPWASVAHVFGAEDIVVAGQRWEVSPLAVFATIHLGWRPPW